MKYTFKNYYLIHNNKVVTVGNPNFGTKLKKCYYIKKFGSAVHPKIYLDIKKDNRIITKNKLIGDYQSLMDFIIENQTSFIFIGGFSRAGMAEFIRMLNDQKHVDIKPLKFKDKFQEAQYERHLETKQERIEELNERLEKIGELKDATEYMKVCNYVFGKDRHKSRKRILELQRKNMK